MTRALVIGGGGLVGLGWGIGWLDGLSKAGGSLADADRIIGTSAGAALATMVDATDRSQVAQLLQLAPAIGGGVQQPEAVQLVLDMDDAEIPTVQAIGRAALVAPTMPVAQWIGVAGMLGGGAGRVWPAGVEIVVTDVDSGERCVLHAGDCSLVEACAASAAAPGILPVVPLVDRRYMDGGVVSATNADLAVGADRVLVLRLVPARTDGSYGAHPARLEAELAVVTADALVIAPEAFPTGSLMDASLVSPAYTAGYWQGKNGAAAVLSFWGA